MDLHKNIRFMKFNGGKNKFVEKYRTGLGYKKKKLPNSEHPKVYYYIRENGKMMAPQQHQVIREQNRENVKNTFARHCRF